MKPKSTLRAFLSIAGSSMPAISSALAALALSTSPASAASLYWSGNGTTQGGTGPWDVTTAHWGPAAAGPFGTTWNNTTNAGDTAIFGGAGGAATVTLGTGISVGGLQFNNSIGDGCIHTVTGSTLTLGGSTPTISGNVNANVSSKIAGTAGLTKTGVNTITHATAARDTFTGGLFINGGTFNINYNNANTPSATAPTDLVDPGNTVTLAGGILNISGKASVTASSSQTLGNVTVNAGGGQLVGNKSTGTGTTINVGTITATAAGGSLLTGNSSTTLANAPLYTSAGGTLTNGIYSGRIAYFSGTANTGYDWATTASGSAPYTVSAYSGYTALPATGASGTVNYNLTTAITGVDTQSVYTLKVVGVNLTQTTGTTLTIEGGGLLSASGTAATISGGSITAGNGSGSYDLIVHQGGTGGGQTIISSSIIDNGGNSVNLVKTGPGTTVINSATNAYSGNTYVNAGILDFGTTTPAGSGANIYVVPGAGVKFTAPSTTLMSRIAQTNEEIGIFTGANSTAAMDFSATGANLPNAFLAGGWSTNGAKQENFTGVITPANNTYRIGFTGAVGSFGFSSVLSGANNLIVGGNNVVLTSANTHSGETDIRTGAKLLLANALAMQNSPLNVGSGADTIQGQFGLSRKSSTLLNDTAITTATLGGLIGSRALLSAYAFGSTTYGNNADAQTPTAVTGFTLNPGSGSTYTYSGVIADFATGTAITKTGDGTQELTGANTYNGNTVINGGILRAGNVNALGGGGRQTTVSGNTTVNSDSTLDLNGTATVNEPLTLNGTGFGGNGALLNSNTGATAIIGSGVSGLTIPGASTGSAYATAPTVNISGTGTGATAAASLGVTSASFVVNVAGDRVYTVAPTVAITGGGGSGATATPVLSGGATGTVTGITITNPGVGYTTAPVATVSGGTSTGSTTTTFTGNATQFTVVGLTVTVAGSGYTGTPTYTFSAGDATPGSVIVSSVGLASDSSIGGAGNTTIAAAVSESGGSRSLTKVGAGTLTLSGTNTYSGNTTVNNGTLSLGAINTSNELSTVTIASPGILQLNYAGTDTVDKLFIGAAQQPMGTYGHSSTGATNGGLGVGALDARFAAGTGTLTVTTGPGGPGPLDHFAISAISSPQTVGTPITGITLTAQDAANATVTTFTGTVNFGGSGGFTGTSGTFTLGVLSGVSVTPTNAGSGLTFTVTDIGSGKTGTTTITTIQTQYEAWAGGGAFDADANGDGVKNGLAWQLGATDKNVSALGLLPVVSQSGGNLILNFTCLKIAGRGASVLKLQYSKDLGVSDLWPSHEVVVPDTAVPVGAVNFTVPSVNGNSNLVNLQATIPASAASPGTKLFGRLNTEQ